MPSAQRQEREIRNDRDTAVEVILEPWGMVIEIPPRSFVRVVAASPQAGELEVIEGDEQIAVYAWDGAIISAFDARGNCLYETDVTFPPLPKGMSVRQFTDLMFGQVSVAEKAPLESKPAVDDAPAAPGAPAIVRPIAPALFDEMNVVKYVMLDARHRPTGACKHTILGKGALPPVAALLICKEPEGYYLNYCDTGWNPMTDTWHETLADAVEMAESEYTGAAATLLDWKDASAPVEDRLPVLEQVAGSDLPSLFSDHGLVVVFFRADWTIHSRYLETTLRSLLPEFNDKITFRVADLTDDSDQEITKLAQRVPVLNVPALACFIDGTVIEVMIGVRSADQLRSKFAEWMARDAQ